MEIPSKAIEPQPSYPRLYSEPEVTFQLKKARKEGSKCSWEDSKKVIATLEEQRQQAIQQYETEVNLTKHMGQQLDILKKEHFELQDRIHAAHELLSAVLNKSAIKYSPHIQELQNILHILNGEPKSIP